MRLTRTRALALLAAVALVATLATVACGDDDAKDKVAAATGAAPPHVTITAKDFGFDAPDTLPAGRVTIDYRNQGPEEHHAQFVRLNDGVTVEQFTAALAQSEQSPEAALSLIEVAGGPGVVASGRGSEITLDLKPGAYVMFCVIPSADGVPHFVKGMLKSFRVADDGATAAEPRADGEVVLGDFSILMPPLQAGTQTFAVTNAGRQPHEVVLLKLTDGALPTDAVAFLLQDSSPPLETIGGTTGLATGQRAWVTLDLTAGNYLAVCFIPDAATGAPHFALGMATTFSVP